MTHRLALLMLLVVALGFSASVELVLGQTTETPNAPREGVMLAKLSDPTYPPLARQARIEGEVDLMLAILKDGTVESAVVVSGHPMLTQSALDSAQRSQFLCGGFCEAVTSYALRYKFQITARGYPKDCDTTEKQPPAEVDLAGHQVTVSAWAMEICDPSSRILKVRSAKCLYLWKCGSRAED